MRCQCLAKTTGMQIHQVIADLDKFLFQESRQPLGSRSTRVPGKFTVQILPILRHYVGTALEESLIVAAGKQDHFSPYLLWVNLL